MEETGSESASGDHDKSLKRRRRYNQKRRSVVNPDENFYFYWLMVLTVCILYNLWTLIVRQSFPELQVCIKTHLFYSTVESPRVKCLSLFSAIDQEKTREKSMAIAIAITVV